MDQFGIPSAYLTSDSDKETRNTVQKRLVDNVISFIFVVDLYNEGVDIPEVDTVLFLRPTESLTIFLQQLGRGLRLSDDKDFLTVIDFVGQANKNYRYDLKFRALTESGIHDIASEVEKGFPHLPAGCSIELERKSKDYILENIRQAINLRRDILINRAANFTTDTGYELKFDKFLEIYDLSIDDIYKKMSWSRLLAEAGIIKNFKEPDEKQITKGLRRLQYINDIEFIDCILTTIKKGNTDEESMSEIEKRYLNMFLISLWKSKEIRSIQKGFEKFKNNPTMLIDTVNLLEYKKDNIKTFSKEIKLPYKCTLALHASYSQAEILAGLGYFGLTNFHTVQSGVLYIEDLETDIFFITLNKNEKDYSPTTMYHDYAINDILFHWQSQSATTKSSDTGQRYINQRKNGSTVLLFVRVDKAMNGLAQPYYFLGPADYVEHNGEKPINIVWKLRNPMPASLLRETKRLVVG